MIYDEFLKDTKTQDAVVRNIEIMGEAVKNVSDTFRNKCSKIKWKNIAGMRDRLIHDYFGVNWDVVKKDLPQLIIDIEKFLLNT